MLNTPSNLYSGAAQVFNDMPHVAFQTRLLQQHAAKQDALDQYYRKMPLTINEKGVRDQERPIIAKSMLEIKDYYIKNKDKLKKGDDAAAFNYEKMVRNHQDLVGRSQQAGLTDTQVGKFKFTPALQYMFQSPETVQKLAAHHLPIDDPNHIDFDLEEFTAPPKPLVKDTYMKRYDKLKFNEEITTTMNKDGTEMVIKTPTPSKEVLDNIMSNATQDYLHDPSVTVEIDKFPTDNTNPYNSVFKKHWGRDIENPIDATAAFILANKLPQPSTQTIDRTLQRDRLAKGRLALSDAYIRGRMRVAESYREAFYNFKSAKDEQAQAGVLDKFIKTSYDSGTDKLNGQSLEGITVGGTKYKGRFIEVPTSLKQEYRVVNEKGDAYVYPDRFYLTEDKKSVIPVFLGEKTASGGNYIKPNSRPIPIQIYKASLGKILLSKNRLGEEVVDDDITGDVEYTTPTSTKTIEVKKVSSTTNSLNATQRRNGK